MIIWSWVLLVQVHFTAKVCNFSLLLLVLHKIIARLQFILCDVLATLWEDSIHLFKVAWGISGTWHEARVCDS